MKIDTLGVQAFVAIAEHGGFQRAAASLHITQTALSRRLQNLEAFLGVRLVERSTRSVALTRIGADFLPRARRLLSELASALTEIRETGRSLRGDVTLACIQTVSAHYLPGVVQRYAALHPENRIRILDHAAPDVEDAVLRREAEFGVTMETTRHRDLHSVPFHKDRFVAVCRDDHALAGMRRVTWKQLEPYTMIFAGHEVGARSLVDQAIARKELRWRHFYEVQRSSTAIGMVARGVGITVVSDLAIQPDAYPRLRAIPLVDPVVSRTLVLITRTHAQLSPAAQALYDLMRGA